MKSCGNAPNKSSCEWVVFAAFEPHFQHQILVNRKINRVAGNCTGYYYAGAFSESEKASLFMEVGNYFRYRFVFQDLLVGLNI